METKNTPQKATVSCATLRARGFFFMNTNCLMVTNKAAFSYNGKMAVLLPQNVYGIKLPMQSGNFTKLPNLFVMV